MHDLHALRHEPASPRRVCPKPTYPRCLGVMVVAAGLCMGCEKDQPDPPALAGEPAPAFSHGSARPTGPSTPTPSHEAVIDGEPAAPFVPAASSAK